MGPSCSDGAPRVRARAFRSSMVWPVKRHRRRVWSVLLPTPDDTMRFAARIADFLRAGDLVTLSGDLGVGKTAFARALVRHLAGEPDLEVPSPTFTLMQLYDTPSFPVVHGRPVPHPLRLGPRAELGWDEASDGALLLVEWAERIGDALPEDRLDVTLAIDGREPRDGPHRDRDWLRPLLRPHRPDAGGGVASGEGRLRRGRTRLPHRRRLDPRLRAADRRGRPAPPCS